VRVAPYSSTKPKKKQKWRSESNYV